MHKAELTYIKWLVLICYGRHVWPVRFDFAEHLAHVIFPPQVTSVEVVFLITPSYPHNEIISSDFYAHTAYFPLHLFLCYIWTGA